MSSNSHLAHHLLAADRQASARLADRLVSNLYRQVPTITAGLIVLYGANFWVYGNQLAAAYVVGWTIAFALYLVSRGWSWAAYRRDPARFLPATWQYLFLGTSVLLGVSWAILTVGAVTTLPPDESVMAIVTTVGIVSASVATTSASPAAFLAVGVTMIAPTAAILLMREESFQVGMGIAAVVYLVVMAKASRDIHRSIRRSIFFGLQNEALVARLDTLSLEDALTGLSNRRALDEGFERMWTDRHPSGFGLGVILCDIDFFKQYNDALGHQAGDDCLRRVATIISAVTRANDTITARYGGEEFAIVVTDCDLVRLEKIAGRLRQAVRDAMIPHPTSTVAPYVTISAGAAHARSVDDTTADDLMRDADRALYVAKSEGRNCVRLHDEGADQRSAA